MYTILMFATAQAVQIKGAILHGSMFAMEVAFTSTHIQRMCSKNSHIKLIIHIGHQVYNNDGIFTLHFDFLLNVIL